VSDFFTDLNFEKKASQKIFPYQSMTYGIFDPILTELARVMF